MIILSEVICQMPKSVLSLVQNSWMDLHRKSKAIMPVERLVPPGGLLFFSLKCSFDFIHFRF
jgi:hypothetical protein